MTESLELTAGRAPAAVTAKSNVAISYLTVVAVTFAVVLTSILAINVLVDPLWYRGGNRLTNQNYAFDERTSKAIRLLTLPSLPQCVLFGASSGTLMNDADKFAGAECYNFAFSAGNAHEFQAYAGWLAAHGVQPATVVLEVGAPLLRPITVPDAFPAYIREGGAPPSILASYLSVPTLGFSLRSLLHLSPVPRYYNSEFKSAILQPMKPYSSTATHAFMQHIGTYEPNDAVAAIAKIRSIWPQSKVVCYVSPIAADFIRGLEQANMLDSYASALWAVEQQCNTFRDFSMPSDLTTDPMATYDGSHFTPQANARVAGVIAGSGDLPMSSVAGLTPEAYAQAFRNALVNVKK